MNSTFANELLTKKQLAEILKLSTRTIDRMISEDRFPKGIKINSSKGGAVRWAKSVALDWIAQRISD
jgi:predicted DNA-binding transcriptional regulator AlpA